MKLRSKVLILLFVAVVFFLAGYIVNHGAKPSRAERKILYYVDPMNPAIKSDKPGIAACGMALEPVYDNNNAPETNVYMPSGTIRISSEKQQLIGVTVAMVEKAPWSHTLRVLGRVTPDETLVNRITGATSGWIEHVLPVTTGSLVKKNELLATFSFFATEYRTAVQAYLNYATSTSPDSAGDKVEDINKSKSIGGTKQQRGREIESIRLTGKGALFTQSGYYRQVIQSYGMSDFQLEEIKNTRKVPDFVEIRAPIEGFILSRNVSPGLRFDRGTEFYRIADLSRVWILADVFENEASYFKPGMQVRMELPYQKKILYARTSNVLPQFDPASRTLKIRLIADNPGFAMRPDMFVNVDLPMSGPPAIIVPMEAVLDSGLKKTVFVDRGNGYFEPRQVETGRSLGERIEITRGLMPGEKIVVSGNFLLDSETRMQQASSVTSEKISRDPVCGMNINETNSKAAGYVKEYLGKTYFFCSPECLHEFEKAPDIYLKSGATMKNLPSAKEEATPAKHTHHNSSEMSKSHDMKTMSHKQEANHMSMPGNAAPMTPAKTGDVFPPKPGTPAQMMPGSSEAAPMMPMKTGDAFPPATGAPSQTLPGSGNGIALPGSPGGAPMIPTKTSDVFLPAPGTPSQMTPGSGNGTALPGSPGTPNVSPPASEKTERMPSRPPRRRGAVQPGDTDMPDPQKIPSMQQQKNKGMITPETKPDLPEQQKNPAAGDKAHD